MNICFLGCGNIAQAMIDGLIRNGVSPSSINCIERNERKIELLKEKNLKVIELDSLAAENFDLVILAVKPKDALNAEKDIFNVEPKSKILTVVAGIELNKYSNPNSVIRSMPNTSSAYGKGITALYAHDRSSKEFNLACKLFEKVGHIFVLKNEEEMHVFTSIIGSGQAFLFEVLRIYLSELEKIASYNEDVNEIFKDFVSSLGDSFSNEPDFETLINKIKSPGGTTQAGLKSLEKNHLESIFKQAFRAAKDRSIEISNEQ
tara:strand:- start:2368 stop:3150 length:783 start_codon:yes stop_codon:yes gene_type:complete